MSRIIRLSPARKPTSYLAKPIMIGNQSLFSDMIRLANLYHMAFPLETLELKINSWDSVVDGALEFFYMIEDQYFPLEHMWDWDDCFDNYAATIQPWLEIIPVKVLGPDRRSRPESMIEPKALLARLNRVGGHSASACKHKQVLLCQYPDWVWGELLDTFKLSPVIEVLDQMILPPPFEKLPALVKYMSHETGTYFLDYTTQDWPHQMMWNKFNIDWLKGDWQSALQIMNQVDDLCHWLVNNPSELEKVWTILKAAHERRKI